MYLLVLIFSLFNSFSYGKSKISHPVYVSVPTVNHSSFDIDESNLVMNQFGYSEFDYSKKGKIIDNGIDQMYFDLYQTNKLAILKFDIALPKHQKILKLNQTDFVCHGKNSRGRFFALFVSGETEAVFKQICNQLFLNTNYSKTNTNNKPNNKVRFFDKVSILNSIMFRPAQATVCHKLNSSINSVSSLNNSINSQKIFSQLGTCVSNIFRGASDGVTDILSLFTMSPAEIWAKAKDTALQMKNFVLNIKSETLKMVESLRNLDSELIVQMACTMIGQELVAGGIMSLIGVGAVKILNKMVNVASKIKKNRFNIQSTQSVIKIRKNKIS